MKPKDFSRALLVAIALSAASGAMAAPSIGSQPSTVAETKKQETKKQERARRPTLEQAIESKVMSVVGVVQGVIADIEAREVRAKMAMAAKARAAMEAKARAAMEAKAAIEAKAAMAKRNALASEAQAPCPYDPDNGRSATDAPSSLDRSRCR
jgi:hypothetical protein